MTGLAAVHVTIGHIHLPGICRGRQGRPGLPTIGHDDALSADHEQRWRRAGWGHARGRGFATHHGDERNGVFVPTRSGATRRLGPCCPGQPGLSNQQHALVSGARRVTPAARARRAAARSHRGKQAAGEHAYAVSNEDGYSVPGTLICAPHTSPYEALHMQRVEKPSRAGDLARSRVRSYAKAEFVVADGVASPIPPAGHGRRPQPRLVRSRLRFCPPPPTALPY